TPAIDVGTALAEISAQLRAELDRQVGSVTAVLDRIDRMTDPAAFQREAKARVHEAIERLRANKAQAIAKLKDQLKLAAPNNLVSTGACSTLDAALRDQIDAQARRFEQIATDLVADVRKTLEVPLHTLQDKLGDLKAITDPNELKKAVEDFLAKAFLN